MKKIKSAIALLIVAVMALSLTACGGSKAADTAKEAATAAASTAAEAATEAVSAAAEAATEAVSTAAEAATEAVSAAAEAATEAAAPTGDFESYMIGHTSLGTGPWILDMYQNRAQYAADLLGMTLNPASANFSSDQMVKDIQNQIAAGEKGHLYFAALTTLTPTVNEMFEKAGVYWGVYNQLIAPADLDAVNANPYYCGSVGGDHTAISRSLGKMAADMGYKKAALMAGAIGDTSSDLRIDGFAAAFEEAGGEVVAVARCSDPSEAAAKSDDLLSAHGDEIDCFYALNMDFILAAIHSAENFGIVDNIKFISSECDAEGLEYVKKGTLIADSNDSCDSIFCMALVLNALDGHKIVDENGNAPYYDCILPWIITTETADDYQKYFLDQCPLPTEVIQSLLYRYNPDVSYESFKEVLVNYNHDWIMTFYE